MIKQLSGNIVIYGFTNALRVVVPFLMLPILTTYLTTTEFGLLSMIETTILFLFPFISLNIFSGISVEYYKLKKEELRHYISNAFLLSLLSFIFFMMLAYVFRATFEKSFSIPIMLVLSLPIFAVLRLSSQVVLSLLQMSNNPKYFAILVSIQTLVDFALSYLLVVMYTEGYWGRLAGIYIAYIIASIISIIYLYQKKYLGIFTFIYSSKILRYTLPLIPHVIGGVVIAMSDRYFIAYYVNNEVLAYYTVAYQLASVMLLLSVSVNQAWTPLLYRFLKEGNSGKKILNYSMGLMILFVLFGIIVSVSEDILFYFFVDEKFHQAKEYYLWLLIGFIFQSLYFLVTNFLFYESRTKTLALITFLGALVNLCLNYVLIQQYGTIGVAYATTITWVLFFIVTLSINILWYTRRDV